MQLLIRRPSFPSPLPGLMLHGEASDGQMMKQMMQSTGWVSCLAGLVDFTFEDAVHPCAADTKLHSAMHAAGLYQADHMYWGQ